jgi:hypothetical protein
VGVRGFKWLKHYLKDEKVIHTCSSIRQYNEQFFFPFLENHFFFFNIKYVKMFQNISWLFSLIFSSLYNILQVISFKPANPAEGGVMLCWSSSAWRHNVAYHFFIFNVTTSLGWKRKRTLYKVRRSFLWENKNFRFTSSLFNYADWKVFLTSISRW